MTVLTATTYGSEFGEQETADTVYAWLNGDDEYTEDQMSAMVDALYGAYCEEIDKRLPDDVYWQPATSQFVHPVGADLPGEEEMREIWRDAWDAVVARYDGIEREQFGRLPATLEGLERALEAIGSPIHRARVAGLLADAKTRQMAARVRREAIHRATREYPHEEVARLLGTGVTAVRKAIREHNAT